MTGLFTFISHINIYWWCSKQRFHYIKKCMDVEIDDGEVGTVWFGYGYDNYDRAFYF